MSAIFCSGLRTWSADRVINVHCSDTLYKKSKESACEIMCMFCPQTSPKRWFANVNTTSYCDVTNSIHPITMNTTRHCSILECGQRHVAGCALWSEKYGIRHPAISSGGCRVGGPETRLKRSPSDYIIKSYSGNRDKIFCSSRGKGYGDHPRIRS